MSRRSFFVAIGIVVLLGGTLGTGLLLLLRYEPTYYSEALPPEGEQRQRQSKEFLTEFSELQSNLNLPEWSARFTDQQINSFLNETFAQTGLAEKLLPEGITDLRVAFEPEHMRLAFRYRGGLVNTVVSVTLRFWLPRTETNVLAVQLEGFRAGLVPFTAQWLLEHISETARQNGIEVTWYRHEGHPVALVRFQADQARSTLQFKGVQFEQGQVIIHGRSTEGRAALPSSPRTLAARD
jgi:hypothetical protein